MKKRKAASRPGSKGPEKPDMVSVPRLIYKNAFERFLASHYELGEKRAVEMLRGVVAFWHLKDANM